MRCADEPRINMWLPAVIHILQLPEVFVPIVIDVRSVLAVRHVLAEL